MTKNIPLMVTFGICIAILCIMGSILFVSLRGEIGMLIIHRNVYGNVDISGSFSTVMGVFGIMMVMELLNGFLAYIMFYREQFLSYMFCATTIMITLLSVVIGFSIIMAN